MALPGLWTCQAPRNPVVQQLPFISIIFPTLNNAGDTLETLASLGRLDYPRDLLEILIWDNGSMDDSPARIRKAFEAMESQGWAELHSPPAPA